MYREHYESTLREHYALLSDGKQLGPVRTDDEGWARFRAEFARVWKGTSLRIVLEWDNGSCE
jgi:hypothetical protein